MATRFLNDVHFTSCPTIEDSINNHKIQAKNRLDYLKWLKEQADAITASHCPDYLKSIEQEIFFLKQITKISQV